ncbi:MAG: SDR family oxidoreductase [Spirochaeta sp.]|nr:SDR family oxidoreductase [Spirochaeta sp.]
MNKNLTGKNYIVVGGSSGIGAATVTTLLDAGASVTVWSRSEPAELVSAGAEWAAVDVTEEIDATSLAIPEVLHGLVYAPGSINLGSFRQLKPQVYLDDFNLNVVGAVRALKVTMPALSAAEGASVVFFGTVAATVGMQFHASIASAKAALIGLAKTLAAEYAAKKIRFNVVSPSLTDTPMAARLLRDDKKRAAAAERHPLQRVGAAEDIASTAVFFLDPDNSWITGPVIGVDGGLSAISGL